MYRLKGGFTKYLSYIMLSPNVHSKDIELFF